jgi:hypothetical protein
MNEATRKQPAPGPIVLFGSGETSPAGHKIFNQIFRQLPDSPRVAILETPAGFELNSPQVAGRVGTFIQERLKNYHPQVTIVPARKRGTPFSPDDPALATPLQQADLSFMGPGSPTYAVRQLADSYAWNLLVARQRLGASLVFASAATVAISAYALPVYEIYKVGEDIHWKKGLNLFESYGLQLVIIPHWNNNDGGAELDTSRCFIGQARFDPLMEMLPEEMTVIGLDERSGLLMDFVAGDCQVLGATGITLIRHNRSQSFQRGDRFPFTELGPFQMPEPSIGIPPEIWRLAQESPSITTGLEHGSPEDRKDSKPPREVLRLVNVRQEARQQKDWQSADEIRDQIEALGWHVMDTPEGPQIVPTESQTVK